MNYGRTNKRYKFKTKTKIKTKEAMPRVRIGAAYKFGSTTGVALLQDGNKVALQVFQAQEE
eukprot:scaffold12156_cov114-Isochrysis_galbana.AAC.4